MSSFEVEDFIKDDIHNIVTGSGFVRVGPGHYRRREVIDLTPEHVEEVLRKTAPRSKLVYLDLWLLGQKAKTLVKGVTGLLAGLLCGVLASIFIIIFMPALLTSAGFKGQWPWEVK